MQAAIKASCRTSFKGGTLATQWGIAMATQEGPANWINFLVSLVPLAQTILWILFAWLLLTRLWQRHSENRKFDCSLVSKGDHLKVGPVELGISSERLAELQKLPEASPLTVPELAPEAIGKPPTIPETVEQWVAYREGKYRETKGFFLAHTLVPSKTPDQKYDVFITVNKYPASRRFKDISISDIESANFFWGDIGGIACSVRNRAMV